MGNGPGGIRGSSKKPIEAPHENAVPREREAVGGKKAEEAQKKAETTERDVRDNTVQAKAPGNVATHTTRGAFEGTLGRQVDTSGDAGFRFEDKLRKNKDGFAEPINAEAKLLVKEPVEIDSVTPHGGNFVVTLKVVGREQTLTMSVDATGRVLTVPFQQDASAQWRPAMAAVKAYAQSLGYTDVSYAATGAIAKSGGVNPIAEYAIVLHTKDGKQINVGTVLPEQGHFTSLKSSTELTRIFKEFVDNHHAGNGEGGPRPSLEPTPAELQRLRADPEALKLLPLTKAGVASISREGDVFTVSAGGVESKEPLRLPPDVKVYVVGGSLLLESPNTFQKPGTFTSGAAPAKFVLVTPTLMNGKLEYVFHVRDLQGSAGNLHDVVGRVMVMPKTMEFTPQVAAKVGAGKAEQLFTALKDWSTVSDAQIAVAKDTMNAIFDVPPGHIIRLDGASGFPFVSPLGWVGGKIHAPEGKVTEFTGNPFTGEIRMPTQAKTKPAADPAKLANYFMPTFLPAWENNPTLRKVAPAMAELSEKSGIRFQDGDQQTVEQFERVMTLPEVQANPDAFVNDIMAGTSGMHFDPAGASWADFAHVLGKSGVTSIDRLMAELEPNALQRLTIEAGFAKGVAERAAAARESANKTLEKLMLEHPNALTNEGFWGPLEPGLIAVMEPGVRGEFPQYRIDANGKFEPVKYGSKEPMTPAEFTEYVNKVARQIASEP